MLDYKITKQFIRSVKFQKELAFVLAPDSMEYKMIMHHRFKLIACTAQEIKLSKKIDRLAERMKAEPADPRLLIDIKAVLLELNHHRKVSEHLKFTIRNSLIIAGVI